MRFSQSSRASMKKWNSAKDLTTTDVDAVEDFGRCT
jgi:hypothetical protein